MPKVAIIGAGHAGLLAMRECLVSSILDPICFEVSFQSYGLYHKINPNIYIEGYKTANDFIEELELIPVDKIKFGSKVVCVRDMGDGKLEIIVKKRAKKFEGSDLKSSSSADNLLSATVLPTKGSDVDLLKGDSESPNSPPLKLKSFYKRYLVDRVIIATGEAPYIPDFDGMDDYLGKVIHSTEFKVVYPFVGQNVLVVGSSPIALQIANALADHCKVDLCSRGKLKLLPMTLAFGVDTRIINSRVFSWLHPLLKSAILEILLVITRGYGIGISRTIPAPSPVAESINTYLKSGKIIHRPPINKFTARGCIFSNSKEKDYDLVICCTGFKQVYPFIDKEYQDTIGQVFSRKDQRIAFLGKLNGVQTGNHTGVFEIQAKWVVKVFTGICKIPKSFVDFAGVGSIPYMDAVAKELKASPKILWLAFTNWSRLIDALFGYDFLKQYGLHAKS